MMQISGAMREHRFSRIYASFQQSHTRIHALDACIKFFPPNYDPAPSASPPPRSKDLSTRNPSQCCCHWPYHALKFVPNVMGSLRTAQTVLKLLLGLRIWNIEVLKPLGDGRVHHLLHLGTLRFLQLSELDAGDVELCTHVSLFLFEGLMLASTPWC